MSASAAPAVASPLAPAMSPLALARRLAAGALLSAGAALPANAQPFCPIVTSLDCAARNSSEPNPSEHSEAMISVPPGASTSSGVTMPLTVW